MNNTVSLDNTPSEVDLEFIECEALKLPPQERAGLAEILISSIDPVIDLAEQAEIDKAWAEEADRRYQEMVSGTVPSIPVDEVMRQARTLLK